MASSQSPPTLNDAHCHFFSANFFRTLHRQKTGNDSENALDEMETMLGWEIPRTDEGLAERWIAELDRNRVDRAAVIGSVPGDEVSVARAVALYPKRLVGFFMLDPRPAEAPERVVQALELGLRCVCLFPAMHGYSVKDKVLDPILRVLDDHPGTALFVHCGALSVGVRTKLGLPSHFDLSCSDPLDVHWIAARHPGLPVIIPHFGAGLFREALMAAHLAPNVYLDTSSSNGWTLYHPGLTLDKVFRTALDLLGPKRLLFGTDSSFFPRGWQSGIRETQRNVLDRLGLTPEEKNDIFVGNFERLFPRQAAAR
jgi:uncharacterized protein